MYLGTSAAAALDGTVAACRGQAGCWKSFAIAVWYVDGFIASHRGPCFPHPILTGWLTCLLEFYDGFRGYFCSWWPLHILLFSWRGIFCEYIQVWKSLLVFWFHQVWCTWIFLEYFSPSLMCLIFLEWLELCSWVTYGIGLNFLCLLNFFSCVLAWLEFAVLVDIVYRLS